MAAIVLKDSTLSSLQGKVVVITGLLPQSLFVSRHILTSVTGSARGIGAATVRLLHSCGSKVVHGDWDAAGQNLDAELSSSKEGRRGETTFVQTDVTDYDSVLGLFDAAWKKYARVDVAISNAGIQEAGNWFDPEFNLESIKTVSSLF